MGASNYYGRSACDCVVMRCLVVCRSVIAIEILPEVQMTQFITWKHYDEMITKILQCKSYNDTTITNQESNQLRFQYTSFRWHVRI
jgi:hypothetical protein